MHMPADKVARNYLYCLTFSNGKKYIGLTNNPQKRLQYHLKAKNGCPLVQAAIKKYGSPRFDILCIGSRDYIRELEGKAIAAFQLQKSKFGYNIHDGGLASPSAAPGVGAKISASLKGRPVSTETRAKIAAALTGNVISTEQRSKISAALKGRSPAVNDRPVSLATRAKLSAVRKGHPVSEKTRAAASATHKGKVVSAETRAKQAAAKLGRKLSAETRAKMSAARMGRTVSPETRAKIRAAQPGHRAARDRLSSERQPDLFDPHDPTEALASAKPPRKPVIPASQVAPIRSWLKYGMTAAQVAEMYGVGGDEVERFLRPA
jgi:group I intron endonuclease